MQRSVFTHQSESGPVFLAWNNLRRKRSNYFRTAEFAWSGTYSPRSGHVLGESAGESTHTVTAAELPMHMHDIQKPANGLVTAKAKTGTAANKTTPEGNYFAENIAETKRFSNRSDASMANAAPTLGGVGGSQPHENRQPYLVLNYVIALQGVFPSRN
jgi:microcystin-dependent protein